MSSDPFCPLSDGRKLCYRTYGEGRPLLLIAGLSLQLGYWPAPFISGFVERGFQVIIFDNRDVGRSSYMKAPPPKLPDLLMRRKRPEDYDLSDMAADAIELLNHLSVPQAHVAGISMGGMIAQMLAANHPDRVLSLTSIYSSTGSRFDGQPSLKMQLRLIKPAPRTEDEAAKRFVETMNIVSGAAFPPDDARLDAYAREAYRRASPGAAAGVGRQLMAILKSGSRRRFLKHIKAPTLVVHGDRDPLVHPSGGRATAAAIPGARLKIVKGMGHDLAAGVVPLLVNMISEHALAAGETAHEKV